MYQIISIEVYIRKWGTSKTSKQRHIRIVAIGHWPSMDQWPIELDGRIASFHDRWNITSRGDVSLYSLWTMTFYGVVFTLSPHESHRIYHLSHKTDSGELKMRMWDAIRFVSWSPHSLWTDTSSKSANPRFADSQTPLAVSLGYIPFLIPFCPWTWRKFNLQAGASQLYDIYHEPSSSLAINQL